MSFAVVLISTTVLVLLLHKALRKYRVLFYGAAILLVILYIVSVYVHVPGLAKSLLFLLMQKCTLSLALFMVVMYIGIFDKSSKVGLMLRPVRAELSILACILAAGHMAVYLAAFLPRILNTAALDGNFLLFVLITLVLFVLIIILGVTSLQAVKSRMKSTSWIKLQKWAYVFFALVYLHLVTILLPSALAGGVTPQIGIALYTVLFGVYAVLRIRKWIIDKDDALVGSASSL